MSDIIEQKLTAAMREADVIFERVGGGTRHYVRDCLLPMIEKHGVEVVLSAELQALRSATIR